MTTPLRLSVVVVAQTPDVDACIQSLRGQAIPIQIVLVDAVGRLPDKPDVTLIRVHAPSSLPRALATGIAAATGDIIAITETHCTFPPNWAERVIAAHREHDAPVIGGAVMPGTELQASDLGLFFADYATFLLPFDAGASHVTPGCNVSFKRGVLDAAQESIARDGFWKTFFCESLEATGAVLQNDPTIIAVYHRRMSTIVMARRRFTHGRCFGGMRKLRPLPRAALLVGAPLLPFVLFARLAVQIRRKIDWRTFAAALPNIGIALAAWAIGEWWGTLFGTGESCQHV